MNNKKIKLSKYFFSNKLSFLLLIIGNIGAAISLVIWSFFMKKLADVGNKGDINGIKKILLFGLIFLIIFFIMNNLKYYFNRQFLKKVNCELKNDVFNALISKDLNDFNSDNTSKYISVLNNDVAKIETDYFKMIPDIIEDLITFFIATITLFMYNPSMGIIELILSFALIIIPFKFGKKSSTKQEIYFGALEKYNVNIKDIFNGLEVIKSFNAERETVKTNINSINSVENSKYNLRKYNEMLFCIQYMLTYITCIIFLVFSIYLVIKKKITFGVFLGGMQISNYVSNPIREASVKLINLKSVNSLKEKIEEILNCKADKSNLKKESLKSSTPIKLINLNYKYDKELVLKNLNFEFKKGKKYAIVGQSGSGKSTLIKLIMKYYDKYEGKIVIGTQNLKDIDKISLNNSFAMIHQRVIMFDDSLKNNITMFKNYPNEDIEKAIKHAGLQEIIMHLPKGLNSKVSESGNNFSGGEQQRISIARAFLKNSSVMILDEATSSLDNETSLKIENLILDKKELTAIVVTHRLTETVLKKYDCIIALKHGEILEYGSFDELINNKGYFYNLYNVNGN